MIYRYTIITAITALIIVIGLSFYNNATKDTYEGMSIIIEKEKDIPLYEGLKPRRHHYEIKGDHVEQIYTFYKEEMSKNDWNMDYMQFDEFNISDGFHSRWLKEGFKGELMINSYYNQAEGRTTVIFDHIIPPKTTVWLENMPDELCVYEHQNVEGCTRINSSELAKIVQYINEFAWDVPAYTVDGDYGILSFKTEKAVMNINVFYSKEKDSIFFESTKGFKQMKPETEFLQWTMLTPLLNN